jgi:hypothetical protein
MTTLCAAPLSSSNVARWWNSSPRQYFGWLYNGTVIEGAVPATVAPCPAVIVTWVELLSVRSPAGEIVRFGTDLAAATAYAVSIGEDVMGESLAV